METYLPPNRKLSIRTTAISGDNKLSADNIAGWLLTQMHLAGKNVAAIKAHAHVEPLAINDLTFYEPIVEGDEVCCYAEIIRMDRTSLTLHIEALANHPFEHENTKVAEGTFTYIAVGHKGEPFNAIKSDIS